MIVRVTFEGDVTMLFGDSYKSWRMQFDEYCWQYKKRLGEITAVDCCSEKWKSWGGLKWCSSEQFQNELNREGCQEGEPDNPNARQYADMKFVLDSKIARIAQRILLDARNNQTDHRLIHKGILPKGA